MAYYTNFIKGIKAVYQKGKMRKICYMCDRQMKEKEMEEGEQVLHGKLNLMEGTVNKQKEKVNRIRGKVEKVRQMKTELFRLDEIHREIIGKNEEKEKIAKQLIELSRKQMHKDLGKGKERDMGLKTLQNSVIFLEENKEKIRKFCQKHNEEIQPILRSNKNESNKLGMWDKLREIGEIILKDAGIDLFSHFDKRVDSDIPFFFVDQELQMALQLVIRVELNLELEISEKSFIKSLEIKLFEQVETHLKDANTKTITNKLSALNQRLQTECDTLKTKIMNGISKIDQKQEEIKKIESQVELLQKEVKSFFSQEEFDNILNKTESLMNKTEFELNNIMMETKMELNEISSKQNEAYSKLESEKTRLNQKLCKVEDYKIRFEGVLKNTKIKSTIRLKKGLEMLVKNTQKDKLVIQDRVRFENIKLEIDEITKNIVKISTEISEKSKIIEKIKKVDSEKIFYKTEKNNLNGKKSLLLEKSRSLMRVILDVTRAENIYKQSLAQLEYLTRCKSFMDKLALEIEKKIHEYHTSRIKRINDYINRIWQYTYDSKDILEVYIELSDDGKKNTLKKNFSYKLKGKFFQGRLTELKGRCSAGQKMMISIVVRLALAEAFCGRCKFISLDEPTTNLDKKNADRLAGFLRSFLERDETQVGLIRIGFILF
jgi:DNA repair protein RAD50